MNTRKYWKHKMTRTNISFKNKNKVFVSKIKNECETKIVC